MPSSPAKKTTGIRACRAAVREVETRYEAHLSVNEDLTRELVSFQANKKEPFYRWLKFKEGFSSKLVQYCINRFQLLPHVAESSISNVTSLSLLITQS